MLKKLRIIIATICFIGITLLFLDFTGTLHGWLHWLAKVQFFPAVMASNIIILGTITFLTLLFGRIYCSTLCPLGVCQDILSRATNKRTKNRFSYARALNPLRYSILTIFILAIFIGIRPLTAFLEPYSIYGRIASNLVSPIYSGGNNLLAYLSERINSYAFYSVDIWIKSISTFTIALLSLTVLIVLAWKKGRIYCNSICPAGTVLGLVSKFSLLKPRISEKDCTHCGLCEKNCKASCIDAKAGIIDYTRCLSCFNCIDLCPQGGIKYTFATSTKKFPQNEPAPTNANGFSRRKFLTISSLFAMTIARKTYAQDFDGGLALIKDKKKTKRNTPIVPPGSISLQNLQKHCTACQLCVSACPNQVLSPSSDMMSLMQPEMSYERGYCRPECTKCSEVCPNDAIQKIRVEEKSSIQIGHAVWKKDLCIVNRDNVSCDNCARHCPTGAIQMTPINPENPETLKIPVVDESRCIGCGACENLCPTRPYSAIYVEGHEMHKTV